MRAVLRTLAQCHAHRILHRDIKPGNFMLLTEAEDSPLKAIGMQTSKIYWPVNEVLHDWPNDSPAVYSRAWVNLDSPEDARTLMWYNKYLRA